MLYSNLEVRNLSFNDFEAHIKAVFDHPSHRINAIDKECHYVVDYLMDFWSLAANSRLNVAALQGVFLRGLCGPTGQLPSSMVATHPKTAT